MKERKKERKRDKEEERDGVPKGLLTSQFPWGACGELKRTPNNSKTPDNRDFEPFVVLTLRHFVLPNINVIENFQNLPFFIV